MTPNLKDNLPSPVKNAPVIAKLIPGITLAIAAAVFDDKLSPGRREERRYLFLREDKVAFFDPFQEDSLSPFPKLIDHNRQSHSECTRCSG
jgi:hypothetical protein